LRDRSPPIAAGSVKTHMTSKRDYFIRPSTTLTPAQEQENEAMVQAYEEKQRKEKQHGEA